MVNYIFYSEIIWRHSIPPKTLCNAEQSQIKRINSHLFNKERFQNLKATLLNVYGNLCEKIA